MVGTVANQGHMSQLGGALPLSSCSKGDYPEWEDWRCQML